MEQRFDVMVYNTLHYSLISFPGQLSLLQSDALLQMIECSRKSGPTSLQNEEHEIVNFFFK
jgi:hypothetical protein